MTTIVADKKTLAVDTRICIGNSATESRIKLFHKPGHGAVAVAGHTAFSELVARWIFDGAKPDDKPLPHPSSEIEWAAVLLNVDGRIFEFRHDVPDMEHERMCTQGSGGLVAEAVYRATGDVHKAMEIACEIDVYTSGPCSYYYSDTDESYDAIVITDAEVTSEDV